MGALVWPNGAPSIPVVSSEYGMRINPVDGGYRLHAGIDLIRFPIVCSPVDGEVIERRYNGGFGNLVRIRETDTGDVFYLAHNASFLVSLGAIVTAGQPVAVMGTTGNSTGVHCHFEVHPGGGASVNPRTYYANRGSSGAGSGGIPFPNPTTGGIDMFTFYPEGAPDQLYLATYEGRVLKVRPTVGIEAKMLRGAAPKIPTGALYPSEVIDLCAQGGYVWVAAKGYGTYDGVPSYFPSKK